MVNLTVGSHGGELRMLAHPGFASSSALPGRPVDHPDLASVTNFVQVTLISMLKLVELALQSCYNGARPLLSSNP